MADITVEVAGEVNAFAGFTVADEDVFGFGLDAAGVVAELAVVAVTGFPLLFWLISRFRLRSIDPEYDYSSFYAMS